MSDDTLYRKSIELIHEKLGDNIDIYGVGFSLGANHLLRYLGEHHHNTGLKAAISISNPFDVLATTVRLKHKFFGIYDGAIMFNLKKPFLE